MPVTKGIGAGVCTPDKEDGFRKYIILHAKVVQRISWYRDRYYYIDTNSGSGDNGPYGPGSPALFLDAMRLLHMPYAAHFIDRESANAAALRDLVQRKGCPGNPVEVYEEDNREAMGRILPEIPAKAFGLIYMDPNGIPDFELLARVAEQLEKLDVLIRCPCGAIKRNGLRLLDLLGKVKKAHWNIRRPLAGDSWQWTFLFGTNYRGGFCEWKREGFYSTTSPEGTETLLRLNFTADEIAQHQQPELDAEAAVEARSGGVCEVCRSRPATEKHHLRYGSDHTPEKLIDVCHECHCRLEDKNT